MKEKLDKDLLKDAVGGDSGYLPGTTCPVCKKGIMQKCRRPTPERDPVSGKVTYCGSTKCNKCGEEFFYNLDREPAPWE